MQQNPTKDLHVYTFERQVESEYSAPNNKFCVATSSSSNGASYPYVWAKSELNRSFSS